MSSGLRTRRISPSRGSSLTLAKNGAIDPPEPKPMDHRVRCLDGYDRALFAFHCTDAVRRRISTRKTASGTSRDLPRRHHRHCLCNASLRPGKAYANYCTRMGCIEFLRRGICTDYIALSYPPCWPICRPSGKRLTRHRAHGHASHASCYLKIMFRRFVARFSAPNKLFEIPVKIGRGASNAMPKHLTGAYVCCYAAAPDFQTAVRTSVMKLKEDGFIRLARFRRQFSRL
jgi:hypothetical protein